MKTEKAVRWRSQLLDLLKEMADFLENGDGPDLYAEAQEWIIAANEILPYAQIEWQKSIEKTEVK